jgi:hypothetical protein
MIIRKPDSAMLISVAAIAITEAIDAARPSMLATMVAG